jgi:Tol biopolymer transport system component
MLLLLFGCVWSLGVTAMGIEEKVFRTGLEATKGWFTVSPDGRYLVFKTNLFAHGLGLRLLDLRTGHITVLPEVKGRSLGFPDWSPDGKQLAVLSAPVRDNRYVIDDMQIVLLDATTWRSRAIASGEGVKWSPFFSADGKTVYYFKGKKRESGKTPANDYDLFAIDLASGRETKLTDEAFYQASKGDEQAETVLFAAYGWKRHPSKYFDRLLKREQEQTGLYLYDKASGIIKPLQIDQSGGGVNFYEPQRDRAGNVYFITNTLPPRSSRYKFWLGRATPDGKSPALLTELPIDMGFDIARNTGEIYVMDKQGEEIIFRRLPVLADH